MKFHYVGMTIEQRLAYVEQMMQPDFVRHELIDWSKWPPYRKIIDQEELSRQLKPGLYTDLEATASIGPTLPVIHQRLRKDQCWVTRYKERYGFVWTEPSRVWWHRIVNIISGSPIFTEEHCHVYTEPAGKDMFVRLSYENC